MRYTGGVAGYLEVLTNETNSFSAELGVVQARLNELLALVQLYQALGGGWQQSRVVALYGQGMTIVSGGQL